MFARVCLQAHADVLCTVFLLCCTVRLVVEQGKTETKTQFEPRAQAEVGSSVTQREKRKEKREKRKEKREKEKSDTCSA